MMRDDKEVNEDVQVSLSGFSYITTFRIRQALREARTIVIMFVGMGIAILLMVWGFSIYGGMTEYANDIENDVPYEYMYILTNPLQEIPEDSEPAYTIRAESKFELTDENMPVTLLGLEADSEYYDFADLIPEDSKYAVISNAAAKKFGYEVGDTVTLYNSILDKYYALTITDLVEYSNGLYFFMNIDALRDLDEVGEDYYNTLLANQEVDVDENMLVTTISRQEISEAAYLLLDSMMGMILTMIAMSIILFFCVMYLLMKMIVDRSSFNIFLLKILGYRNAEVRKIYLNTSFYILVLSILVHIPLSQFIVSLIFPNTVSDVAAYIRPYLSPPLYIIIPILIFASYFFVYILLYKKIKDVSFAEVLKRRE